MSNFFLDFTAFQIKMKFEKVFLEEKTFLTSENVPKNETITLIQFFFKFLLFIRPNLSW